jgi:cephalosporin hydroxylase
VKIYRSSKFTDGQDGYDYMNYMFRREPVNIEEDYQLVCSCLSDINEHLPTLRQYAEQCNHITELGTRWGNSTVAFMSARPDRFISYDVQYNSRIDYLIQLAKDNNINFEFRLENVEQVELEPTDLLFIDTNHHMEQCSVELKLHADKARKFIIFHDTTTFWEKGQGWEVGHGLRYAIEPFLEEHPEWVIAERFMNNNGLLILKRIA